MTAIREALQWYADEAAAIARHLADFKAGKGEHAIMASLAVLSLDAGNRARAALSQDVPQELPPLPVNRWAFFCTKCMYSCDIDPPGMVNGVKCPRCGYFGFAQEKDYTADQMRAYGKACRSGGA